MTDAHTLSNNFQFVNPPEKLLCKLRRRPRWPPQFCIYVGTRSCARHCCLSRNVVIWYKTVQRSCITNPQQLAAVEFETYSCASADKISTDIARRAVPLRQRSFLYATTIVLHYPRARVEQSAVPATRPFLAFRRQLKTFLSRPYWRDFRC